MHHRRRDVARERVQRVADLPVGREDLGPGVTVRVCRRRPARGRHVLRDERPSLEVVDAQVLIAWLLRRQVLAQVQAPAVVVDCLDPEVALQLDAPRLPIESRVEDGVPAHAGLRCGRRCGAEALLADVGVHEGQPPAVRREAARPVVQVAEDVVAVEGDRAELLPGREVDPGDLRRAGQRHRDVDRLRLVDEDPVRPFTELIAGLRAHEAKLLSRADEQEVVAAIRRPHRGGRVRRRGDGRGRRDRRRLLRALRRARAHQGEAQQRDRERLRHVPDRYSRSGARVPEGAVASSVGAADTRATASRAQSSTAPSQTAESTIPCACVYG